MTRKELIEQKTGLKLVELESNEYELYEMYFIDYWQDTCRVIELSNSDTWGQMVRVEWSDGSRTKHATPLNPKKDFRVIMVADPEEEE